MNAQVKHGVQTFVFSRDLFLEDELKNSAQFEEPLELSIKENLLSTVVQSCKDWAEDSAKYENKFDAGAVVKEVRLNRPSMVDVCGSRWAHVVQSWKGRVVYDDKDRKEFVAILSDKTNPGNYDEEVLLPYSAVTPSDVKLISEGAVFFWTIGKFQTKNKGDASKPGPIINMQQLRFRRLPGLSEVQVAEIKEISRRIAEKLNGN